MLCLALALPAAAAATEAKTDYTAVTVTDPGIDIEELDIIAAPLTVDELKIEADAWQELVKGAAENVANEKLRIRKQDQKKDVAREQAETTEKQTSDPATSPATTAEPPNRPDQDRAEAVAEQAARVKDVAMDELTRLRSERNGLIERMNVILERINQKIGLDEKGKELPEVLVYRRYIDAVGGIKLDVSDAETAYVSIMGWLASEDGGIRWAKNVAMFLAIVIGFYLVGGLLSRATRHALAVGGNQSSLLEDFLVGMVRRIVVAIGLIVALSAIGINIGPLLAVIGAAGFVIAFALQNTLSNFASGMMILMYRPFDVDDLVEVAGITGRVKALNLVSATINTLDNKLMIVPNNEIWGNIITNATGSSERRVDMVFGIGYEDDIEKATRVLEEIVAENPLVLKEPEPVVQLHELGDSSVNFVCRPWAKTDDYWAVYWEVTRRVKERFDEENISIPFPQRDVHLYPAGGATLPATAPQNQARHDTRKGSDQMGLEDSEQGD